VRSIWIVGLVVACTPPSVAVPQHATVMPPSKPTSDEVVFEPPPRPEAAKPPTLERYGPRDLIQPQVRRTRDEVILLEGRWRKREPQIDVAEIDFLSRCARDFVYTQPDTARRALVDAFTHYVTTCDATGKVVLERPIGFDSRDRRTRSDLSLVGSIGPRGGGVSLRVAACGSERSFDRVTLVADGESWTSSRLEVRRDPYNCDIAELPYTKALSKMLRLAIEDTREGGALIRFDGAGVELTFSDVTRDELRSVLDAIDAVTVL
jgi:hypothetical protein